MNQNTKQEIIDSLKRIIDQIDEIKRVNPEIMDQPIDDVDNMFPSLRSDFEEANQIILADEYMKLKEARENENTES